MNGTLFSIYIFLTISIVSLPAFAESSQISLPVPTDGTNAGLIINSTNAGTYKDIVVPELYPLVRARLIELDSVARLRVDLSPFAVKSQTESPPADWREESDLEKKSHLLLNDLSARYSAEKVFSTRLNLTNLAEGKVGRQIEAEWIRTAHPPQLWRELVNFDSPTILSGLNLLTFRFSGTDEDILWMSSPSLKKVIQLTGSNRSDSILDSALSLDDFLGWSGKPSLVEVVIGAEKEALVPFAGTEAALLDRDADGCHIMPRQKGAKSSVPAWNYLSQRFPDAFTWLPTEAVFTPRKLLKLEFIPRDPFSLYGRQILYVDAELMVVYYKFVFDRGGFLWKTIVNVPGLFKSKDNAKNIVFSVYQAAENRQSKSATVVEFSGQRFCAEPPQGFDPARLEPGALIPKEAAPASPPAKNN